MLLEQVLARWWCPVASSEAMELLLRAMRAVLYRRTTTALIWPANEGVVSSLFVACRPDSCQGDTEQVSARSWWFPGLSGVSLAMQHSEMPRALLQHVRMAIKMACNGGTCVCCRHLFSFAVNVDEMQCYGQLNITPKHNNNLHGRRYHAH